MAFREVTVLEVREVLRLSRDGLAKKRIARQVGLDVKTVRRYLELAEASGVLTEGELDAAVAAVVERLGASHGRPRGEGWDLCQAHRGFRSRAHRRGARTDSLAGAFHARKDPSEGYGRTWTARMTVTK